MCLPTAWSAWFMLTIALLLSASQSVCFPTFWHAWFMLTIALALFLPLRLHIFPPLDVFLSCWPLLWHFLSLSLCVFPTFWHAWFNLTVTLALFASQVVRLPTSQTAWFMLTIAYGNICLLESASSNTFCLSVSVFPSASVFSSASVFPSVGVFPSFWSVWFMLTVRCRHLLPSWVLTLDSQRIQETPAKALKVPEMLILQIENLEEWKMAVSWRMYKMLRWSLQLLLKVGDSMSLYHWTRNLPPPSHCSSLPKTQF